LKEPFFFEKRECISPSFFSSYQTIFALLLQDFFLVPLPFTTFDPVIPFGHFFTVMTEPPFSASLLSYREVVLYSLASITCLNLDISFPETFLSSFLAIPVSSYPVPSSAC